MKHATADALATLEPLLAQLRALPDLKERKLGIFYRAAKAYLHFHEDPLGLFADVRLEAPDFTRFKVSTLKEQRALFAAVKANCSA